MGRSRSLRTACEEGRRTEAWRGGDGKNPGGLRRASGGGGACSATAGRADQKAVADAGRGCVTCGTAGRNGREPGGRRGPGRGTGKPN